MAILEWDKVGERLYETGVDKGVLYPYNVSTKKYTPGVAWNGLTSISETPEGGEPEDIYADNIKYLSIMSAETFGGTIEAYMYPDAFAECNGEKSPEGVTGVVAYQQERKTFGLCYRTIIGSDTMGNNHGYKLHLVYGCKCSPSEKSYSTVSDSPEPTTLSWEYDSTPVPVSVEGIKPVSVLVVDSTKCDSAKLKALEEKLYGSDDVEPELPLPDEVFGILKGTT